MPGWRRGGGAAGRVEKGTLRLLVGVVAIATLAAAKDSGSPNFKKMRVKSLKKYIADRGYACEAEDGGPCIEKQEFVDFAWKIVDAPKVKKMGMMEEQRHNDKSQLKLFGWGDGVGKGQIEFLIDDDLTGLRNSVDTQAMMVFYYASWCGGCTAIKPHYVAASEEAFDHADINCTFVAVDCEHNPNTCKAAELVNFPTFIFYADTTSQPEEYKGDRGSKGVIKFLSRQFDSSEWKNEALWEDGNGQVVHVTDNYWDQFVAKNPLFMIMFYAPWCGHCKAFKPTYVQVSEYLGKDYTFAAMDCTEHPRTCGKFDVEGYPTIKIFDSSVVGPPEEYEGERTLDGLLEYYQTLQEADISDTIEKHEEFLDAIFEDAGGHEDEGEDEDEDGEDDGGGIEDVEDVGDESGGGGDCAGPV